MAVFLENLTSKIIREFSSNFVNKFNKKLKILEVGCGDGNITKYLIENQNNLNTFFLSDISQEAINKAKININYKNITFKVGNSLEPWINEMIDFDIIISDVSAISSEVAKVSDWYDGVSCDTDIDGLKNIKLLIKDLDYFNKYILIMPQISLCNIIELNNLLRKKFKKINLIEGKSWPLPSFFISNLEKMVELKKNENINYYERFGMYIAKTDILCCHFDK